MTVYVDDAHIAARVGRHSSTWCHLWTDSDDQTELHESAARLGLRRSWFQRSATRPDDVTLMHYDLTAGKRAHAVRLGAVEISWQDAVEQRRRRRTALPAPQLSQRQSRG